MIDLLLRAAVSLWLLITVAQNVARAAPDPFGLPGWFPHATAFGALALALWFVWEGALARRRSRSSTR